MKNIILIGILFVYSCKPEVALYNTDSSTKGVHSGNGVNVIFGKTNQQLYSMFDLDDNSALKFLGINDLRQFNLEPKAANPGPNIAIININDNIKIKNCIESNKNRYCPNLRYKNGSNKINIAYKINYNPNLSAQVCNMKFNATVNGQNKILNLKIYNTKGDNITNQDKQNAVSVCF
jgi:hypothetical protein